MNKLNIEQLQDLVIELKAIESSDIFDEVGEQLTDKATLKIMRLQAKQDIITLERKIMNLLKQAF